MTTILDYYATHDTVHIFVLRAREAAAPLCFRVPFAYDDLHAVTSRFRKDLEEATEVRDTGVLFDLLLKPVYESGAVSVGEPLVIVPHRCLHAIPFACLLPEPHAMTHVAAGATILSRESPVDLSGGCLVVRRSAEGDTAGMRESFRRESENVAAVTGGLLLPDTDATIENITREARGRSVVHFTCHGQFDATEPRESGLFLADQNGRDFLCDVMMLSQLRLDAELVVLAACETGLSERHPGDELVGLLRAFTLAGARSVLATLWRVNSVSTEMLVDRFYRGIVAGELPREALQAAQRDVRACSEYRHPYFWAPFFLFTSAS
jgi:CHAT domain-containing protein